MTTVTRRELLAAAVVAPALRSWSPSIETLTADERAAATKYLTTTRDQLLGAVRGLSQSQWRFSPAAGIWSAAEIVEHVTVVEEAVLGQIRAAAQSRQPLPADRRPRLKDQVIELVTTNRTTRKLTSPEVFRPTNRWETTLALVAAFTLHRRSSLDYVAATGDDLRAYAWDNPLIGLMDGYQWLLFVGGHCERHALQLVELRSHAAFPAREME